MVVKRNKYKCDEYFPIELRKNTNNVYLQIQAYIRQIPSYRLVCKPVQHIPIDSCINPTNVYR